MDFDFMDELRVELEAIAGQRTVAKVPDWRKTPIGNWEGGFVREAQRIANPEWWRKPSNAAEQSLNDLLKRAGLGRLQDTDERENNGGEKETGATAKEISASQREKEKNLSASASKNREAHADDEGESWREHLGKPGNDARTWLKDLSARVDTNRQDNKGWFGALRNHVNSKPQGARVADLNSQLVELCVRALCTE
jgi:hypothetical protein